MVVREQKRSRIITRRLVATRHRPEVLNYFRFSQKRDSPSLQYTLSGRAAVRDPSDCSEREIMKTGGMKLNQHQTAPSTEASKSEVLSPHNNSLSGLSIVQLGRQVLATILCALLIPMSQADLYAQQPSPPPGSTQAPVSGQSTRDTVQPLTPDQLGQLVAPIALYPDALVAQILAASTYPTQIVDADRWRQAQNNASASQIAARANNQSWDPSVKALTAFPTVLAQLDKNLDWTANLGNAYYNQPQDVMDAVQAMRQRAQSSGNLKTAPQQNVSTVNGNLEIAPANPSVVYVPVYNPWLVYGSPLAVYPGFYYVPPPEIVFGTGLAIGFGIGIGIGVFGGWGWGWNNWRCGWHSRAVFYNHATFVTHSNTVINRGFHRPGGPAPGAGARGAYGRGGLNGNRAGRNSNVAGAHRASQNIRSQGNQRSSSPRTNASSFGARSFGGTRGFGGGARSEGRSGGGGGRR